MLVKFISQNTFDVFIGNGWDNWTRFEIAKDKDKGVRFLRKVGGQAADRETIVKLKARFCR